MLWSTAGLVTSLALAALAFARSRASGGFYDADVYGMTPAIHRRYGAISLVFAALFAGTLAVRAEGALFWILAGAVLFDLFYLTSYLRGAHEDDV
ncbi:MAG: hypothetical protein KGN02_14375 [bacterium]|nr:hypothetical protein [bacterium]